MAKAVENKTAPEDPKSAQAGETTASAAEKTAAAASAEGEAQARPEDADVLEPNETELPVESQEEDEDPMAEHDRLVEELNEQVQEARDKHLRLLAEFENFRRRTAKESIQVRQMAARDLIADLLPVLDDFDRAASILAENPEQGVDTDGFHLIAEKFRGILKRRELTPMAAKGQAFDPEQHEAITEVPAPEPSLKGKVIDVIEEGYLLGDTIIRHAKVVVGK